jgi:serine protease Do
MFEDERNNYYDNNSYNSGNLGNDGYSNQSYGENSFSSEPPVTNDFATNQPVTNSFVPDNEDGARSVNSYEWGQNNSQNFAPAHIAPKEKPKKEKKPVSKGALAIVLIAAIVLSTVLGIGGGVGSYFFLTQSGNTTTTDNGLTINKSSTTGGSEGSADGTVLSTKEITDKVADSVVEIVTETVTYSYFYGQAVSEGAGSGVIIDDDGYIITNNHVIEDAKTISVTLRNGNEYDAKLIGADSDQDIALIKIEPKSSENLTVATFGDSDKLSVGDKAVVIGNPLGKLGGTVTDGIISALDRELTLDEKTMNLLQTNAAINPGNSGGGLFDGQGNLIGIVVAKASSSSSSSSSVEGLGFAIPINDAESILSDLKDYGYVKGKPADIGVTLQDYMNMVYIYSVTENSPADKGGLEKGDKIMSIDGKDVTSSSDVKSAVSNSKAGDKLKIKVERNGETKTCTVTVAEQTQSSDTEETTSYQYDSDSSSIWNNYGF